MAELDIIFLGTGGSTPTISRNPPAMAIEYDGGVYFFDCGEGTQRQAMQYSLNISKTQAIFVTHAHGDHIIGLAGLIRTLALNKRERALTIFVPKGQEGMVTVLLTFDRALIGYKIEVRGVGPGIVYRGKDFTVRAFRLGHTIATLGYVFEENGRQKFLKAKCKRLGMKGKDFRVILGKGSVKIGKRTIKLDDVSNYVAGKKVVYATDTRPLKNTVRAARNADILVHESSYGDALKMLAAQRKHSTAGEAAGIAKRAKARKLVLFHISARYKDAGQLLKDARRVFKNTVVAEDGMRIKLQ